MVRLRYMSIRPVPSITIYNHPSYPKLQRSEVPKLPTAGIGVIFKASAPLLEKVEEKVENLEEKREVTPTQQVTAQATS